MILPVFVFGYQLYGLVVKDETFEVVSSFEYKFPYFANYSESFITQKKLIEAVSSLTKIKNLKREDLLIISDVKWINNIRVDYLIGEILSKTPFLVCRLGQYGESDLSFLNKDEINQLMTQIYLYEEVDESIRYKVDTNKIKSFLNDNAKKILSVRKVALCNTNCNSSYKKNINDFFISEVAQLQTDPFICEVVFDYGYKQLLRSLVLMQYKTIDIDLIASMKVLFVPNAIEAQYFLMDEKSKEKIEDNNIKIKPNSINLINIPNGKFIKLKITGDKLKFSCDFDKWSSDIAIYSKRRTE